MIGPDEFWTPETIWRGATVFVIGGGSSLRGFDFNRLRGRNVVAINRAGYDASFADVLFFTDFTWMEANRLLVENWGGRVVTSSRRAKELLPQRILRVCPTWQPRFPKPGVTPIRRGRSSGHTAVSLAVAMGAARIVLLGFDCHMMSGRSHYHDDYSVDHEDRYSRDFLPKWKGWRDAAMAVGVEIVNATPGSMLTEFPVVEFDELLAAA